MNAVSEIYIICLWKLVLMVHQYKKQRKSISYIDKETDSCSNDSLFRHPSKKIHWISTLSETATACSRISKNGCISLDMEGVNLGALDGITSLVQIGISECEAYVFDALAIGTLLFCTEEKAPVNLGCILSNARIIKLCYDCRADARALHLRHCILPCGMYDLQIVYTLLYQSHRDPFLKGMHKAMKEASIAPEEVCLKMNTKKLGDGLIQSIFERPLNDEILLYCVVDVACLFPMYVKWSEYIEEKVVLEMTDERIRRFMYNASGNAKQNAAVPMSKIDFQNKKNRLSKWMPGVVLC